MLQRTGVSESSRKLAIHGLPPDWLFPTTRYRGSKRKLLSWVWEATRDLNFDSALDLFGGTAVVSLLFKRMGKRVTYNDYLTFNYATGLAFVENKGVTLSEQDTEFILQQAARSRAGVISTMFRGYYFRADENAWLDSCVDGIQELDRFYSGSVLRQKRALAVWALGQSCLIKRPFNLFHRRNLPLRTNHVFREFGNKKTWETPFSDAFARFVDQANGVVFDNGRQNEALCSNALLLTRNDFDLIYIDPPYFSTSGRDADYYELYHFLEGLCDHECWPFRIDYSSATRRLRARLEPQWGGRSASELLSLYAELFARFRESIIVLSHKSSGLIRVGALLELLSKHGKRTRVRWRRYNYALSRNNGVPRHNIEWLLIGS